MHQQRRRRAARALPASSAAPTSSQQRRAVGQAGQLVVPGLPGQRLLVAHPLGDVGVGDDDPRRALDPRGLQPEPGGARTRAGPSTRSRRCRPDRRPARPAAGRARRRSPRGRSASQAARHGRRGSRRRRRRARSRCCAAARRWTTQARFAVRIRPSPSTSTVAEGSASRTAVELARSRRRGCCVGAHALVDVPDDDGQPAGVGIDAHLEPVVPALVQVLEHPRPAVGEDGGERLLDDRAAQARERRRGTAARACPSAAQPSIDSPAAFTYVKTQFRSRW